MVRSESGPIWLKTSKLNDLRKLTARLAILKSQAERLLDPFNFIRLGWMLVDPKKPLLISPFHGKRQATVH